MNSKSPYSAPSVTRAKSRTSSSDSTPIRRPTFNPRQYVIGISKRLGIVDLYDILSGKIDVLSVDAMDDQLTDILLDLGFRDKTDNASIRMKILYLQQMHAKYLIIMDYYENRRNERRECSLAISSKNATYEGAYLKILNKYG